MYKRKIGTKRMMWWQPGNSHPSVFECMDPTKDKRSESEDLMIDRNLMEHETMLKIRGETVKVI